MFEDMEVTAWIDGGWGIEALLAQQTRPHDDLDILIPASDSTRLVAGLRHRGFHRIPMDDECAQNFVMGHPSLGRIDFHVMELTEAGDALYSPRGEEWQIAAIELDAQGEIEGRVVRCLTPEYQVRAHAGYELQDTDISDMKALQQRFGVTLLEEQIRPD